MNLDRGIAQESVTAQRAETRLSSAERSTAKANGVIFEVHRLGISKRKGKFIFKDISLYIQPGELVTLAGPDGAGKTSLLSALAGIRPANEGKILINGANLYGNRKAFSPRIGYVSHQSAVQPLFTVNEVLSGSARLRMPRGTKTQERRERIEEVIQLMDLDGERKASTGALSPSARWRLQIAVELVANPILLFIDEPDELPDPGAELVLMERLRRLTKQGLTVVAITRSPKCILLSDKVILLDPAGRLAWFGPPVEAIDYFSGFQELPGEMPLNGGKELPGGYLFGIEDIFAVLKNHGGSDQPDWAERYKSQPEYEKYVDGPLSGKRTDLLLEEHPLSRFRGKESDPQPPPLFRRVSGFQQFFLLLGRNFKLILRDKIAVLLGFGVPLLLACGLFFIASPQMYDPVSGDATQVAFVTALLVFLTMMTAVFAFTREVVKEAEVYRREHQVNLLTFPYILAKVGVIIPIALYQGLVWTGMYFLATQVPNGVSAIPGFFITLSLAALAGGIIGLIASALASSVQVSVAWALLLVLPQLLFNGGNLPLQAINPAGRALAAAMPASYAFQALVVTSGYGRDIANDMCWALPEDQRQSLTDVQKQACPCMGANIFSACNFPGVREYASPSFQPSPPPQPTPDSGVGAVPIQPIPRPGETLDQYAQDVKNYTLQMEIYNSSVGSYLNDLNQYVPLISNWQRTNSLSIGKAEGLLASQVDAYGPIFSVDLISRWLALIGISLALFVIFGIVQSGKGLG